MVFARIRVIPQQKLKCLPLVLFYWGGFEERLEILSLTRGVGVFTCAKQKAQV